MVSPTETRTGDVTRTSTNGFQLNGETRWYGVSRAAKGLEVPAVGDWVEISLDKGFVVQITKQPASRTTEVARPAESLADLPSRPPGPGLPEEVPFINPADLPFTEPLEGVLDEPAADAFDWDLARPAEATAGRRPDKDTQIARMNAITNAVALLSSGGRATEVGDVLTVAGMLEGWITR